MVEKTSSMKNYIISRMCMISLLVVINVLMQSNGSLYAQSLSGSTGLVTIPTADMPQDGEISFGASLRNKKNNVRYPDKYHQIAFYISLGYLPFLEVSVRITRQLNYPGKQALGDRMPSIRLRFVKEKEYLPSLVLGAHDFMWAFGGTDAIHYNAFYAVAAKHFNFSDRGIDLGTHIGYGLKLMKAAHYEFAEYN